MVWISGVERDAVRVPANGVVCMGCGLRTLPVEIFA